MFYNPITDRWEICTGQGGALNVRGINIATESRDTILTNPQRVSMTGTNVSATLPTGTMGFVLAAEGGDIRYNLNGIASSTSPGYLPGGSVLRLKLNNLSSLGLFGAVGSIANLIYVG